MSTYRLITDQQVEADCADLLPAFEQYMRDFRQSVACPHGWTVLPRITMLPGESAMSLRARILAAGPCDYNDLMGDGLPWIVLAEFPFGHYPDSVPGDGIFFTPGQLTLDGNGVVTAKPDAKPFGAFGRIGPFNVESTDTRTSKAKYRAWLTDQMNPLPLLYAPECWVDDKFAYPGYADIGDHARAQVDARWKVNDLRTLVGVGDDNDRIDGEWPLLAQRPVLVNINLDGGFWNRLFNTGSSKDWRAANPGAYLEVIFGSEQDEFWNDDNLMVTAISTPYCNCCYCDWWGEEHLSLFFAGQPIGAVQRAPGYWAKDFYGSIQGSCTHMLLDAQLALVEIAQRVTLVEGRVSTVEGTLAAGGGGGGGGTGGPPPPPGIVVTSAKYRQVGNPNVFKDVTAAVQVLANTGQPWAVHPGLADPFPGILKELWVSWTNSGVAHTQVFGQVQQVVL